MHTHVCAHETERKIDRDKEEGEGKKMGKENLVFFKMHAYIITACSLLKSGKYSKI